MSTVLTQEKILAESRYKKGPTFSGSTNGGKGSLNWLEVKSFDQTFRICHKTFQNPFQVFKFNRLFGPYIFTIVNVK